MPCFESISALGMPSKWRRPAQMSCGVCAIIPRFQPLPLMTPALFVELGLKLFRHLRVSAIVDRIALRTRGSRRAAGAGVLAFPRAIRMAFTDPAAVLAEHAFHSCQPTVTFATSRPHVRFGHASEFAKTGLVGPGVCRPEIVVRRAP